MQCKKHEGSNHVGRVFSEIIAAFDVENIASRDKDAVDAFHKARSGLPEDFLCDGCHQNLRKLNDVLCVKVKALHQCFAWQQRSFGFIAGIFSQCRLHVENQTVFMAAANEVQSDAKISQKVRALCEMIGLGTGDETCLSHFLPRVAVTGGFGIPQEDLQVAQPAQALFDIRF